MKIRLKTISLLSACILIMACNDAKDQQNTVEMPQEAVLQKDSGLVSYYGKAFDGKKTASGEIFNSEDMVAAHPKYPMGTIVRVTNAKTGDSVRVRINDRGPTKINQREGVIIDVSHGAAKLLQMVEEGRIPATVEVLKWGQETDSLQAGN